MPQSRKYFGPLIVLIIGVAFLSACQGSGVKLPGNIGSNSEADAMALSRDSRRKADLGEVRTALELYCIDFEAYPQVSSYTALQSYLTPKYIKVLPESIGTVSYQYTGTASSYELSVALESSKEIYSVQNTCKVW